MIWAVHLFDHADRVAARVQHARFELVREVSERGSISAGAKDGRRRREESAWPEDGQELFQSFGGKARPSASCQELHFAMFDHTMFLT